MEQRQTRFVRKSPPQALDLNRVLLNRNDMATGLNQDLSDDAVTGTDFERDIGFIQVGFRHQPANQPGTMQEVLCVLDSPLMRSRHDIPLFPPARPV